MQKCQHDSKRWFFEPNARYPVFNSFYLSQILMIKDGDRTV